MEIEQEAPDGEEPVIRRARRNFTPIWSVLGVLASIASAYLLWLFAIVNSVEIMEFAWSRFLAGAVAVLVGLSGSIASLLWGAQRTFSREVEQTRGAVLSGSNSFVIHGDNATINVKPAETENPDGSHTLVEPDAQEEMLREIYSHGLAQAKLSFFVSLVFATCGSVVLLSGVVLAIANSTGEGQKYAAITTQTSGVVINLLAGVFFLQSNRARKDMGEQGVMLREDSKSGRNLKAAGVLVDGISDGELRDKVRGQMALQLVESEALLFAAPEDSDSGQSQSSMEPDQGGAVKGEHSIPGQAS
ncbi:hypothetical protein ACH5AL_19470 [Actinacidiphila glaucinigra]|uniref:TRADD-N-associated membrane domain-containing protein n=1 Tax=Actinacidiphila glaucinigra TaxID=235986 RepID=UPI00378B8917